MSINYKQLQSTIGNLIKDLGMPAKIRHIEDNTQSTVSVVFSQSEAVDITVDDVTTITGEQRVAFITNSNKVPVNGDKLIADGVEYRISDVVPYKPTTLNIAYKLVVDL